MRPALPNWLRWQPRPGPEAGVITTSQANQRVRYARSLQRERVRTRQKRFLVEGTRLVEEALRAGARPVLAFYTDRLRGSERGRARSATASNTSRGLGRAEGRRPGQVNVARICPT